MADTPERGIARNSLLNLLGLGLPLVVAIFAIPPLVAGLGAARFGILGMMWVAIAYLNLLDLGLGRATTRFAAPLLQQGDARGLGGTLAAALALQMVTGLAGACLVIAMVPPFVRDVLDLSGGLEAEAVGAFAVLAAGAPALTLASSFRGLLEAGQRFVIVNAVRAPLGVGNFLVPLIGVWLGWSLPTIAAGLVGLRVAALVAYGTACVRAWPGLPGRMHLDRARVRELLTFGGWVTLSTVIGSLLVYADRFVVAAAVSLEAVGYYTVPHEVVTRLEIVPASLVLTLFPAFAAMSAATRARGDLFERSVLFMLALVAPPLLVLAVTGEQVLTIWLGTEFAAQAAGPLRLLALGMIANSLAYIPYAAIQAAGRPDRTALVQLAELPVYGALLWIGIEHWGVAGAAAAWATRVTLDLGILYLVSRRMGLTRHAPDGRMRRLLAALIVFVLLLAGAAELVPAAGFVLGIAVVLGVAWLGWLWAELLEPAERAALRAALTRHGARG